MSKFTMQKYKVQILLFQQSVQNDIHLEIKRIQHNSPNKTNVGMYV